MNAKTLNRIIKRLGITQAKLAKESGLHYTTISAYANGADISKASAKKIREAARVIKSRQMPPKKRNISGELFERKMKAAGLSIKDTAELLDVSPATIYSYMNAGVPEYKEDQVARLFDLDGESPATTTKKTTKKKSRDVGKEMRAFRKKHGISQNRLGQELGVSGPAVSSYERGGHISDQKVYLFDKFKRKTEMTPGERATERDLPKEPAKVESEKTPSNLTEVMTQLTEKIESTFSDLLDKSEREPEMSPENFALVGRQPIAKKQGEERRISFFSENGHVIISQRTGPNEYNEIHLNKSEFKSFMETVAKKTDFLYS